MKNIDATIVTIGDELLIGQVIDTNSSWMAQRLNEIGIAVKKRIAIGDSFDEITAMLNDECGNVDVVLITGGLGPTSDDVTKEVMCRYFNGKMIVDTLALQNVKDLFEKIYRRPVSESNLAQAEVPDVCTVIQNGRGSAPGMIFHKDDTIFICMPGVPYEMQGIMNEVIPYLQQQYNLPVIIHRTILTAGAGETILAEMIKDFEYSLPRDIKLAYLPSYGMVRLRLSTSGFDKQITEEKINSRFLILKGLVKKYTVTDIDISMEQVLGELLIKKNKTIATAESCTGGAIASLITSVPGSSAYFEGSVISYSNSIKEKLLGVKKNTLDKFGAVSEETAIEMLKGLLKNLQTDYGIAVTGIMGPGGGSTEKPVGTVWIAVGNATKIETKKLHQRFDRRKNIEVTSAMALNMMRLFVLEN